MISRWLYPFGGLKLFGGIPVYLNSLNLVIGLLSINSFLARIRHSVFCFFSLFCFSAYFVFWAIAKDVHVLARSVQLLLLISFSIGVSEFITWRLLRNTFIILFFANTIACVLEPIVLPNFGDGSMRKILGITFFRFDGIGGDPNFSAIIFGYLLLLLVHRREWGLSVLCIFSSAFFLSRAVLAVLLLVIGLKLSGILKTKFLSRTLVLSVTTICFAYPIFVGIFDDYIGNRYSTKLNEISSDRYAYHTGYAAMGFENPIFGVGYFRGADHIEDYLYYRQLRPDLSLEQHSIYLQIFSEFGAILYLLAYLLVFRVLWKCRLSTLKGQLAIYFSLVFLSVNGLSEWALWSGFGVISSNFLSESDHETVERNNWIGFGERS